MEAVLGDGPCQRNSCGTLTFIKKKVTALQTLLGKKAGREAGGHLLFSCWKHALLTWCRKLPAALCPLYLHSGKHLDGLLLPSAPTVPPVHFCYIQSCNQLAISWLRLGWLMMMVMMMTDGACCTNLCVFPFHSSNCNLTIQFLSWK